MIEYYKKAISTKVLNKINKFKIGCWINVLNPTKDELNNIATHHSLNIELLEDGLDEHELPRYDHDENNTHYIYVKTISQKPNQLATLLIILHKNFILTLSKEQSKDLELIKNKVSINTTQRLKSLLTILTLIDETIQNSIAKVVKNVQTKKSSTKQLKEKDMETLLNYEDYLNNLVSTYYYTSLLYPKIIKNIKIFEEDKEFLEDLIIETEEGLNLCKNSLKTITNLRNYYSIILTNKLNQTIKILTVFTIMINIPAAIASIYGMNIPLPLQNNPLIFIYVISFIICIMILFITFLRKKKLL